MYGQNTYNSDLLGGGASQASSLTQDRIIFDGYSLDSSYIRVQIPNYDDVGEITLDTFNAPRIDGGGVLGHYYPSKDLTFRLTILGDNAEDLNSKIDEFKERTRKTDGVLKILVNGEYRICEASVISLKFNRQAFHITFVNEVEITFRTMNPHWRREDDLSTVYRDVTGDIEEGLDNIGTVETDVKYYFVFGASGNSVSSVKITIGDFFIQIDESLTNNDILIIDGLDKEVTINNTEVDYVGSFPELNVGFNPVDIDFGVSDTVDCTITCIFPKKYK